MVPPEIFWDGFNKHNSHANWNVFRSVYYTAVATAAVEIETSTVCMYTHTYNCVFFLLFSTWVIGLAKKQRILLSFDKSFFSLLLLFPCHLELFCMHARVQNTTAEYSTVHTWLYSFLSVRPSVIPAEFLLRLSCLISKKKLLFLHISACC